MRSGNFDIWIISASGGEARQLTTHEADDMDPVWSPDGREIAFQSTRSGNSDIWIIPAEGGDTRQVTDHPLHDVMPDWSPDGRWLLFTSTRTGDLYKIYRISPTGGKVTPVTKGHGHHGKWSLDGEKIYFLKRMENIWEISAEGGPERQLTDLSEKYGDINYYNFAAYEQYLYFHWEEQTSDIFVADVEWE
jgi:Tol biopolymer transport system component